MGRIGRCRVILVLPLGLTRSRSGVRRDRSPCPAGLPRPACPHPGRDGLWHGQPGRRGTEGQEGPAREGAQ